MNANLSNIKLKDINIRRILFVRRFLLLSVVMGIASISMIFFAVLPQLQQILETQTMINRENTTLQNLQAKIQGLAQVNDLEEYANKDKVDQALPVQKPLLPLLETARQVSLDSGARIISIETTPGKLASVSAQQARAATASAETISTPVEVEPATTESQVRGVDKIDIAVTVQGTLAQISDFVSRIERSTPITSVTEIQLDDDSRIVGSAPEFTAQLRLSSYYFTRAIQVAIDAPLPETGVKEREFLRELESYSIGTSGPQSDQVQGGGQVDLFGIVR